MKFLSRAILLMLALTFPWPADSSQIDINKASIEELQEIRGVGPVISERIAEMRENCYFYPLDSLTEVSGIGPKTLEGIKQEGKAVATLPPESTALCQGPLIEDEASQQEEKEPASLKVDINKADKEDLIRITGIGEARAKEIISLRPFYSLDELVKIRGVGAKTLESIKAQGLAWIDPSITKPRPREKDNLLKESLPAQASKQAQKSSKPWPAFLTALALSLFSAGTILSLKRKIIKK